MSAHQSAIPSNLSNEIEDEIKYIVYGVADMSDLDHEVEADIAIDRLTTLFNKQIVAELEFLKRLELEFDANICQCGEPWSGTDADTLIKDRIKQLENKTNEE